MIKLSESWLKPLRAEFDANYMSDLRNFLISERDMGKKIYPPTSQWFAALDVTPLEKVRVVILGQDPYHGIGQAHGLSFSVPSGTPIPPSLRNIYKELYADLNVSPSQNGNLLHWAEQGVLLLNAVLTVEAGLAASHKDKGWERFTDQIIRLVNDLESPVVFILWGNYAQKKASFLNSSKHLVLKSAHPSPLSAHNGFFGSKPFSKVNAFLLKTGQSPINWALPT